MNVEIGAEAAQFPEKECIKEIAVAVCCRISSVPSSGAAGANSLHGTYILMFTTMD